MAGRTGTYDPKSETWSDVIYMPCTAENNFCPELPKETPDIIYLCFPNNPTGEAITKEQLQVWVDYANKAGAVIIYDAAYKAYITEKDIPVSIYQCEGAKTCAIELCSFSKTAGFTGLRLAYTVIPKELKCGDVQLHALWARRHGTKYNGAPYIIQRAGEAVYSEAGKAQIAEQIAYYHKNASYIFNGLKEAGYTVAGGVNSPYVWLKTPEHTDREASWCKDGDQKQTGRRYADPGDLFGRTVRRKNEKGKKKNLTKDRMDRNDPDGCRISDRLYGNIGR